MAPKPRKPKPPVDRVHSSYSMEHVRAAEEIDELYPKRVGSPEQRVQWIIAAIKRDGADLVRGGTIAFANACKECGLCRRHDDWGSVPYPQKFYGKTYRYYLMDPYDHLCISRNRVRVIERPGSPRDDTPMRPRTETDPEYAKRFAEWKAKREERA